MENRNSWYRRIPKMDELLLNEWAVEAVCIYGRTAVMETAREELDLLRGEIPAMETPEELQIRLAELPGRVQERLEQKEERHFKRVYNATGVILHTNLGRAPMEEAFLAPVLERLCGYSNLEYDLETGHRGERYAHFERLICEVTGAEAALVVNNNAAAVLLMLSAVGNMDSGAADCGDGQECRREVIVSRGEQIEIGGKFRIPDIMDQSGCKRVEVGTTNKTRLSDYAGAVSPHTAALLKVHTSNFRIEGFTESVSREELVTLGREKGIPVIEDLGSGVLVDLSRYGMKKEPTVMDSLRAGVDLVSFSGDKLLGGPQAGIIVGREKWVEACKKHPLTRAMRIDKFTAAYLEELFFCYRDLERATEKIPVLRMLTESIGTLQQRAEVLCRMLGKLMAAGYAVSVTACESTAGGGSLPGEVLESRGVFIAGENLHPDRASEALRRLEVPVILRIEDGGLLLDMRTLKSEELEDVAQGLLKVLA